MRKGNFGYSRRRKRKLIFVYTMLLYTIIHFIIFYVFVNFNSFRLAFVDKTTDAWNNFANFKFFIDDLIYNGNESIILSNIGNTMLYFLVNTICQLPLAMLFAYFLYKKIFGYKIFMIIFMIPMLISTVVLANVYTTALSEDGIIGKLIAQIFKIDYTVLNNAKTATTAILFFCLWTGFGLNLIMFSGAMSRIPESVVEAARLDGVGFWREFFTITIPMIWPTFSMLLLLSVMSVFASTGPIVLFANQSDLNISTIDFWMYQNIAAATGPNKEYNLAAAFGTLLTIASMPFFFIVLWVRKKFDSGAVY